MTDFYIIHETPFGTERSLYQKVERRMAEIIKKLLIDVMQLLSKLKNNISVNFSLLTILVYRL